MSADTSSKTRYAAVVAHPYLCVCALLEMVTRTVFPSGPSQIEIAEYFGVNAPPGFQIPNISKIHHTGDPTKWGIVIRNHDINNFFRSYSIPLEEKFLSINLFTDWSFEDKIEELLQTGAHIICGYAAKTIDSMLCNNKPITLGHAVAILDIKPSAGFEKIITIYDPGPELPGQREIQGSLLFAAIKARGDGLWVIKPVSAI